MSEMLSGSQRHPVLELWLLHPITQSPKSTKDLRSKGLFVLEIAKIGNLELYVENRIEIDVV